MNPTAAGSPKWLVGVFVGGRARRFDGVAKGLLTTSSGEAIVPRLIRVSREALDQPELRLVGHADAYLSLEIAAIADAPADTGPIGGLRALLEEARRHDCDAVALAGDMPRVEASLLQRLSRHAPHADAVAPRIDGVWQPLFARYRAVPCLAAVDRVLARGRRALHAVLQELGPRAEAFPLEEREQALLVDWDRPSDLKNE